MIKLLLGILALIGVWSTLEAIFCKNVERKFRYWMVTFLSWGAIAAYMWAITIIPDVLGEIRTEHLGTLLLD